MNEYKIAILGYPYHSYAILADITYWKESALCRDAKPRIWHYVVGVDWIGNCKGCSSSVGRQSEDTQAADSVPLTLDLLSSKSIDFDRLSRTATVAVFKSFRSVVFVLSC